MATNTTNFNLKKPAYTDTADIADINGNMDKVDVSLNGLADAIAIVANNNTHDAITAGQYVYVHGHGSLAEGLYTAKSNIAANATLSTSNLQADGPGGLNALNSKFSNYCLCEIVNVSGTTSSSGIIEITFTNFYAYAFCITNVSKNLATPYSVTVDNYNNATHKMSLRIRSMIDNSAVAETTVSFDVMIFGK